MDAHFSVPPSSLILKIIRMFSMINFFVNCYYCFDPLYRFLPPNLFFLTRILAFFGQSVHTFYSQTHTSTFFSFQAAVPPIILFVRSRLSWLERVFAADSETRRLWPLPSVHLCAKAANPNQTSSSAFPEKLLSLFLQVLVDFANKFPLSSCCLLSFWTQRHLQTPPGSSVSSFHCWPLFMRFVISLSFLIKFIINWNHFSLFKWIYWSEKILISEDNSYKEAHFNPLSNFFLFNNSRTLPAWIISISCVWNQMKMSRLNASL